MYVVILIEIFCVSFDMYLQEQKLVKVEVQFAKAIGIPVDDKANDSASIISSLYEKLGTNRANRFNSMYSISVFS
jgi:hypothetical protein